MKLDVRLSTALKLCSALNVTVGELGSGLLRSHRKDGGPMGITKRKDAAMWFPVLDDGKVPIYREGSRRAKLKRWKVGSVSWTVVGQQEAINVDVCLS